MCDSQRYDCVISKGNGDDGTEKQSVIVNVSLYNHYRLWCGNAGDNGDFSIKLGSLHFFKVQNAVNSVINYGIHNTDLHMYTSSGSMQVHIVHCVQNNMRVHS